jgi:hypothetical protein
MCAGKMPFECSQNKASRLSFGMVYSVVYLLVGVDGFAGQVLSWGKLLERLGF